MLIRTNLDRKVTVRLLIQIQQQLKYLPRKRFRSLAQHLKRYFCTVHHNIPFLYICSNMREDVCSKAFFFDNSFPLCPVKLNALLCATQKYTIYTKHSQTSRSSRTTRTARGSCVNCAGVALTCGAELSEEEKKRNVGVGY